MNTPRCVMLVDRRTKRPRHGPGRLLPSRSHPWIHQEPCTWKGPFLHMRGMVEDERLPDFAYFSCVTMYSFLACDLLLHFSPAQQ